MTDEPSTPKTHQQKHEFSITTLVNTKKGNMTCFKRRCPPCGAEGLKNQKNGLEQLLDHFL